MVVVRLVEALFVLIMFSYASRRLLVRAFTSHVGAGPAARRAAVRPVAFRHAQSFATRAEASVEEDLDTALDDILGKKFEPKSNGVEKSNGVDTGTHIEGSHPIPKTLVEKVRNVQLNNECRKEVLDMELYSYLPSIDCVYMTG